MMEDRSYYIANCIERIYWGYSNWRKTDGQRRAAEAIARVITQGGSPAEMHERLIVECNNAEMLHPLQPEPAPAGAGAEEAG